MDIGIFKASRGRLMLWVLMPPLVLVGAGLTSHALKARSEWKLQRIQSLATALPKLEHARSAAEEIVNKFYGEDSGCLKTEEELVSYLHNASARVGFVIDSLNVERRVSARDKDIPMLMAEVKGSGSFVDIEDYLVEVLAGQQLLSESSVKVNRSANALHANEYRADITFELVLFRSVGKAGGGS